MQIGYVAGGALMQAFAGSYARCKNTASIQGNTLSGSSYTRREKLGEIPGQPWGPCATGIFLRTDGQSRLSLHSHQIFRTAIFVRLNQPSLL